MSHFHNNLTKGYEQREDGEGEEKEKQTPKLDHRVREIRHFRDAERLHLVLRPLPGLHALAGLCLSLLRISNPPSHL